VLVAVLGFLVSWIVYLKLGQIQRFVRTIRPENFTHWQLYKLLQYNVHFLQLLQDINQIYSKALFIFIILNGPLNALILMALLMRPLSVGFRIFYLLILITQFMYNFGVHLLAAILTPKFHAPAKRMATLSIVSKRCAGLRVKLTLARYIE